MGSVKPVERETHVHFQEATKSDADNTPEPQCEPGFYISPFDGKKYKTEEQLTKEALEISRSPISDTTISVAEEAHIRAEVCETMQRNSLQAAQLWELTQVHTMRIL